MVEEFHTQDKEAQQRKKKEEQELQQMESKAKEVSVKARVHLWTTSSSFMHSTQGFMEEMEEFVLNNTVAMTIGQRIQDEIDQTALSKFLSQFFGVTVWQWSMPGVVVKV